MKTTPPPSIDLKTQIKSDLSELEQLRKKTVREMIKAMIPFCVRALLIAGYLSYQLVKLSIGAYRTSEGDIDVLWAAIVGIAIIVLATGWFFWRKKKAVYQQFFYEGAYMTTYMKEVVQELIPQLDDKATYDPEQGIPEHDFRQSGFPLFSSPEKYYSSDSISGQIASTTFTFAEVHATQLIKDSQSEHEADLFRGAFFVVDLHKQTHWNTIVYPDSFKYFSSLLIGRFSEEDEFSTKKYVRIKLEDREFEKYFQVYGTDQVEARYLLSPALMARIVDFRKRSKKKLQFSFKESKVYFAVHYPASKRMFRPPLLRSVHHLQPLQAYLMTIQFMLGLARELNLNSELKEIH